MPSRMPALLYCAVRVHGHVRVFYDVRAVVHVHVPCYDGRVSVRVRVSSVLHTCWPRSRALHPHATAHPHVVTPAPAPAPLPARRKTLAHAPHRHWRSCAMMFHAALDNCLVLGVHWNGHLF